MNHSEKFPSFESPKDMDGEKEELDSLLEQYNDTMDYLGDLEKRQAEERERQRLQIIKERRTARPEIFTKPEGRIMKSNMEPFLKRTNTAALREILKDYGNDYEACNSEMAHYLSSILGLNESPEIIYEPETDDGTLGSYFYYSNTITLYRSKNRNKNMTINDINTIAHEMWHAYQHQTADEDGENDDLSPELYRKNFEDYVTAEEDYHGYRTQLVEAEARMFAKHFVEHCSTRLERLKAKKLGRKVLALVLAATTSAAATTSFLDKTINHKTPNKIVTINHSNIDSNVSELDTPITYTPPITAVSDHPAGEFTMSEDDSQKEVDDIGLQSPSGIEEPNEGTIPEPK